MSTRAAGMMFHCVFEGSLSMSEMDKEQRPYHKNCNCALHKAKDETPRACVHHGKISYSKKRSWNKCSLTKTTFSSSVQSSCHSG
ncbi:hypothetical protein Ccrd_026051 [Cynara cardunculus var. scolymus]|uniref:Uncharacterized protein n=1 Tax=Cynara cardunculus var. scolymus TaxID=59895 RepID=A0A103XDE7_CYNCS|nr:hypothetical protein Ccrd_026051 [Cynara cardunculus var. scolymus]